MGMREALDMGLETDVMMESLETPRARCSRKSRAAMASRRRSPGGMLDSTEHEVFVCIRYTIN